MIFTNDRKTNFCLWISYSAYLFLLAVIVLDAWTVEKHFWKIWLLQTIPLLLLAPGLLQRHYRTHSWLCFIVLAYFTNYVVQVYSPSRGILDWAGLILTVVIFISSMFASRFLQRLRLASQSV
jgi:uncharacterized membrane protein